MRDGSYSKSRILRTFVISLLLILFLFARDIYADSVGKTSSIVTSTYLKSIQQELNGESLGDVFYDIFGDAFVVSLSYDESKNAIAIVGFGTVRGEPVFYDIYIDSSDKMKWEYMYSLERKRGEVDKTTSSLSSNIDFDAPAIHCSNLEKTLHYGYLLLESETKYHFYNLGFIKECPMHIYSCNIVKVPTCTEQGAMGNYCNLCGYIKDYSYLAALGHNYNSGEVTYSETCTSPGTKIYTCKTCSNQKTESIAALGHNWNSTDYGRKCSRCSTCELSEELIQKNISIPNQIYSGLAVRPIVNIPGLINGTDYYVSYSNNKGVGTATAKITGKGNCSGTVRLYFEIQKDGSSKSIILSDTTFTYTGSVIEPTVTISGLTEGKDYTVSYKNNIKPGTATVVVKYQGTYTGTSSKTFTITRDISTCSVSLSSSSYTYSGSACKPTVSIFDLQEGIDYTIEYSNNTNAGTATVTITGMDYYTGTKTVNFTISNKTISGMSASLSSTAYVYDGFEKKPKVSITGLIEDADYSVSYKNNINAGTASAIITGIGNYAGTITKQFTIKKVSIPSKAITISQTEFAYDGDEKKPVVTVGSLKEGVDYSLEYKNNIEVGTATVKITGIGNYTGEITKQFRIGEDISGVNIKLSESIYTYDGKAKEPRVSLGFITEGQDYTVSYKDNVNAGTATVTIKGIGNYVGTASKTFVIEPQSLKGKSIAFESDSIVYDGTKQKPSVEIGDLVVDKDFAVEYTDNVNAGTATATVTGIGNYKDTISQEFTIEKADISNRTVKLSSDTVIYDGTAKVVEVIIEGLEEGTDFTCAFENNTEPGEATVTIKGIGNFKSHTQRTFKVLRKISDFDINLEYTIVQYDGTKKKPAVSIESLEVDKDYSVTYKNNLDVGTAEVCITGKGLYTETVTKSFTISKKSYGSDKTEGYFSTKNGYVEGMKTLYYGSYPQTEIVSSKSMCGTYGKDWETSGDCIVNPTLYNKLKNASWDSNGDTTINGEKYHRLLKSDAKYIDSSNACFFDWGESDTRYFLYEPIKWRVLNKNGDDLLVVADIALDDHEYNTSLTSVTWEKSTVRSWLNSSFYNSAFSSSERSFITTTDIENANNKKSGTSGGNNTKDKVFLLSEDDVYGDNAAKYGFASIYNTKDAARRFKSSTYAKAMGIVSEKESSYLGCCGYWLRSPGAVTNRAVYVYTDGTVDRTGISVNNVRVAILPAMHLNPRSNYNISSDTQRRIVKNIKLSTTSYIFDGTAKEPKVTIDGMDEGNDFTVSYDNNVEIGTASVVIKGKGHFSGTVTKYFEIIEADPAGYYEPLKESITEGKIESHKVTSDTKYVYLGSYPQTEVVANKSYCGTNGKSWATDSDCIVDASLYAKLQSATWDSNGDTKVDGAKYHKLTKSEATDTSTSDWNFNWGDAYERYFRYDPIKWRVLEKDGDDLFVVADVALDDQEYNTSDESITWEKSTVRNWLNSIFYNRAFSSSEQSFITTSYVVNANNVHYGTSGGNETQDKVFLLSEDEVYGTNGAKYGFKSSLSSYDTARRFKSSTYAKAMGIESALESSSQGSCSWWLRSPGRYANRAVSVSSDGSVDYEGYTVTRKFMGILPALHINLSSNNVITTAVPVIKSAELSSSHYVYDGSAKEPTVSITGLEEGVDYEVTYKDNINPGTAKVVITGKGGCEGTLTKTFEIYDSKKEFEYTGESIEPEISIGALERGKDYDVTYSNNINPGTASVKIVMKGNCEGTIDSTFKIVPANIAKKEIKLSSNLLYCEREEEARCQLKPIVTIDGLKEGVDFTVQYSNNINPGKGKVAVSGIGNYKGTSEAEFDIRIKIPSNFELTESTYLYDGSEKKPGLDTGFLEEGTDYTLSYSNNVNAGTATVKVTAMGDYDGEYELTFTILRAGLSGKEISIEESHHAYFDTPIEPSIEIKGLAKDKDYTVTYSDNNKPGTGTIIVRGVGNYKGSISREFNIDELTKIQAVETSCDYEGNSEYYSCSCGKYYSDPNCDNEIEKDSWIIEKVAHVWNEDFTVDNPATCTTKGFKSIHCKNCSETKDITVIEVLGHNWDSGTVKRAPKCTESGIRTYRCTRAGCNESRTEEINATGHSMKPIALKRSSISTSGYTAHKECSVCKYTEGKTVITQIDKDSIILDTTNYVYDGNAKTPKLLIKDKDGKTLAENTDYIVKYSDNTRAGIATVTATFMGCYTGEISMQFNIQAKEIAGFTVTLADEEQIYDGNAKKPEVTVRDEQNNILSTSDYTVEYTDNVMPGTAKVAVTFKGNYKGQMVEYFNIICTHRSASQTEALAPTCTEDGNSEYWTCGDCDKYFGQKPNIDTDDIAEGSWIISHSGHYYKHKKVAAGNCKDGYECDICQNCQDQIGYVILHGYSTNYVKSMKLVAAKKACTVKWTKQRSSNQKKFAGYEIQYSTDKNFKKSVKKTTAKKSASSKKLTKLASKKKYYVRVRTYVSKSGKKYYSKWTTKSANIK